MPDRDGSWQTWKAPGDNPQIYAVYVDNKDIVWLSDFGANATLRFDPKTEKYTVHKSTSTQRQRAPDSRPARRGVVAGVGGRISWW